MTSIAYLDTNIWIGLSRSRRDRTPLWDRARLARHLGLAAFPLTGAQYLETWNRGSPDSRRHLAETMRDLSDYVSLAPIQSVERAELALLIETPTQEARLPKGRVLGVGVDHAFSSQTGRLRFIEHLAPLVAHEGSPTQPPEGWAHFRTCGEPYEWMHLFGPEAFLRLAGVDRNPSDRWGDAYASQEERLRRHLHENGEGGALDRAVIALRLTDLGDVLMDALDGSDQRLAQFLFAVGGSIGPELGQVLIERLPTSRVLHALMMAKYRNLQHPWDSHDKQDLMSLAVAVPYADVVVTERMWAGVLNATPIPGAYSTRVLGGATGLSRALDHLGV